MNYKYQHIIQSDDNIFKITVRYYYKYFLWRIIYNQNRDVISDPMDLKPGVMIVIPELSTFEIEHVIIESDTYQSLAEDYYGSNFYYQYIVNRNQNKYLIPGETVFIPPLVNEIHIHKAEEIRNAFA